MGDEASAEKVLREGLPRAFARCAKLHRGESVVAWFCRTLRTAIADHGRNSEAESCPAGRVETDLGTRQEDLGNLRPEWHGAVSACIRSLLPTVDPRYAQVLRRVDLQGESKRNVALEMNVSAATMDVLLHRARRALRRQLEIFCGSSTRESCLAHFTSQ